MNSPLLVSVVLSFRNESENIPTLISRLTEMFAAEGVEHELLFVNDASTDESLPILLQEHARDRRVKVINLSRRFGVAEGVMAGLAEARGDAVVYMDADLQDPPEVVPALLSRWRGGADVVHTVRTRRRGERALKMWATRLAYRIIQSGSTVELAVDAGDFKLLSRRAVDHLLRLPESDPYLRGLVVWLGFNQAFVPYERDARHAGRTHFPFFSRNPWKTFVLGLTSFSFMPVYLCLGIAAVAWIATAVLLVSALATLAAGSASGGPLALAGLIAVLWATTLTAIAIVGLYVVRVYKDVRRRPAYIVQSTVGIGASSLARAVEEERERVRS
jgi:dolichol-phosphate mannosyltransferase